MEEVTATTTGGVRQWLLRQRSSTRLAFAIRTGTMLASAALSLIWARLLTRTLGPACYGLFLSFLAVAQLGGLGDLGVSGAMGVRMMAYLAKGEEELGRRLLANARSIFFGMGLLFLLGFAALSPWLPGWLRFVPTSNSGSLPLLFALGGAGAALMIVNGYFQNLNYIHGNVVWPILPAFLALQLGSLGQWVAASWGAPLWFQYAIQLLPVFGTTVFGVVMLKFSHPWLGNLRPMTFAWKEARELSTTSFWVYLCTLGNLVYVSTDQIVVNAGFGAEFVPAYRFNYKLCELAVTLLVSASFVAMPAIVQRLLTPEEALRVHGLNGVDRLQKLEVLGACIAAVGYLGINDTFITIWQGPEFRVPLALQVAFALNLTVTIAGNAGVQLLGRLNPNAVRIAGLTVGGTGLLNLGLSFYAMKLGSMLGIAGATVVAQTVATLIMGYHVCRLLRQAWKPWVWRSWLLPMGALATAAMLRALIAPTDAMQILMLAVADAAVLGILAWVLGITRKMILHEWNQLRAIFH